MSKTETTTAIAAPALINLGDTLPGEVADTVRQALIAAGLAKDADHADRIALAHADAIVCGGARAESRYGIDRGRNVWRNGTIVGNARDGVKTPSFSHIKKGEDQRKAYDQAQFASVSSLTTLEAMTEGSPFTPEGARGDDAQSRFVATSYGHNGKLKVR
jgi:hypothetical protein